MGYNDRTWIKLREARMKMKLLQALILIAVFAVEGAAEAEAQDSTGTREIFGTIDSLKGSHLVLRTRTGVRLHVDALLAQARSRSAVLLVGRYIDVMGTMDTAGVLHALTINRAMYPALWPPDR